MFKEMIQKLVTGEDFTEGQVMGIVDEGAWLFVIQNPPD